MRIKTIEVLHRKIETLYSQMVEASKKMNVLILNEFTPRYREVNIPNRVQRHYIGLIGFEYAQFIARTVGRKDKVLIIGDAGGRDYYFLKMLGKEIIVLDIAKQTLIDKDRFVVGDAVSLPFKEGIFDAVVMAEVLEHLIKDFKALEDVYSILKADGRLILTVPFGNDDPEYHVRVYTPKTIQRLLESAGFEIIQMIKKGGLQRLERSRIYVYCKHGLNFLYYLIFRKTFYHKLNLFLSAVDWHLGLKRNCFLHKISPYYGGFITCKKSRKKDFKHLNVQAFTDFHLKITNTYRKQQKEDSSQ